MTTLLPLPPFPGLDALTHTTHPVLAATALRLLAPRVAGAMYEDSPYTAYATDPEPKDGDDDNGPWCAVPRP